MATLPPWLDVTPQLYAGTAEAGLRAGLTAADQREHAREFNEELGFKQDQAAQNAALSAQEMQMKGLQMKMQLAQFMQNMKQQNLENSLKVDKFQSDKNIAEQTLAVDKHFKEQQMAWRDQQVQMAQQKQQQAAQVAAGKFAAQQEASQRIAGGEDAAKVLMELGPRIGESGTSLFDFYKSQMPGPKTFQPYMDEVDGQRVFVSPGAKGEPTYKFPPADRSGATDSQRVRALTAREAALMKDINSQTEGTPENIKLKQVQAALDEALGISPTDTNAAPVGGPNIKPGSFNYNVRPAGQPAQQAPQSLSDLVAPPEQGGEESPAAAPAETPAPAAPSGQGRTTIQPRYGDTGTGRGRVTMQPATMERQPTLPAEGDQSTNQVPAEVMSSLRFGKGFQTRAEKEILRNMVTSLSDDDLLARAKKLGLGANRGSKNAAYPEGVIEVIKPGDKTPSQVDRGELEQIVFDTAIQKGWR